MRLEDRFANSEHELISINARLDLSLVSHKATGKILQLEQKQINQIQGQVTQMADMNVILDYYVGEMQQVRAKLDRLLGSVRTNRPDLITIA